MNTSERMTKKLDGILEYTYPKVRHCRADEEEAQEVVSLCYYLWRSARAGVMGFPKRGLTGAWIAPSGAISLSDPMQHDRSMNIIISFAGERIGLECGGFRNCFPSIH